MQQRGAHDRHCSLVKRAVKEELLKPRYRAVPVASVIDEVLNAQGLESQICNSIYLREQSRSEASSSGCGGSGTAAGASSSDSAAPATVRASMQPDDLDVVVEMRQRWGRMIVQNLRKLNEETGQSLLRIRQEGEAAHDRWRGKRMQKQPAKFLYEPSDLVEAVSQARHPNGGSGHCRVLSWGISPIRVRTLTLAQLRERFVDLSVQERQTGVDDELRGWFEEERHAEGQRLLANGYTSLLEQFAKRGVPSGLRARVWLALLRVDVGEREYNYYADLQKEIMRVALITDELQKRDAAAPELEEQYFVFVSMVEELLLCFSRDPRVHQAAAHPQHSTIIARCADGSQTAFPPSGVPPFRGQCQFAFPLCFVYAQPPQLYFVYRTLWTRYWSRLHSFSSRGSSLLPLCLLFEELMQEHLTELCTHLMHLDVHPTTIALPWIMSGFSSALPVEQTLLLWDRVLGFDSLELLPLLAVALFTYRSGLLMQATDAQRVERIMSNCLSLKIIPLLQLFLSDIEALVAHGAA